MAARLSRRWGAPRPGVVRTSSALLMIAMMVACDDDSPVQPPASLDLAIVGSGVFDSQQFAPGFPGGRSQFDGRCSTPSDFVIAFSVTGQDPSLGAVTATLEHCSQFDPQSGTATITDGVMTLLAGGDALSATYQSLVPPVDGFNEGVVFDGGTGRFAGATGQGMARAQCDPPSQTCPVYELVGVVELVGSS